MESAWEQSLRVRDLLKFEFFFAEKELFRQELAQELERIDPQWREHTRSPAEAGALLRASRVLVANRALRSFLDAQMVVAERLAASNPREEIDRSAFARECLGVGRQMLLQGRLHSAESVSQELFGSALALAANRDLVDPGREDLQALRQAFANEIRDVVGLVEQIRQLDEKLIEEMLDARGG